jgi:tripartite-type tricarboxylate transporter receptor subunit TctC
MMKNLHRQFAAAVAIFVAAVAPYGAAAQTYPSKPIILVVPFAAGGSPDIIARALGEELSAALGQNVVIENRGGAGGNIAARFVLDQPADGHTLFLGTSGNMATNKVLYRNLPFDPERDFVPISIAYASCNVLIVPASSPIKTIPDLIAEAKRKPGALSFGSPGVGTAGHQIGELFKTRAGVELVHVPYRGQAQVINDLIGGHLALSFEAVATAIPVVQAKTAHGLATTCPQRSPQIPDVPTFAQAGIPDFAIEALALVAIRAQTPAPIVARLNQEIVRIIQGPKLSGRITGMGLIAKSSTPEQARTMLAAEIARWRQVVATAGIPPLD